MKSPFELFGIECNEGWSKLYQPIINKIKEYNNSVKENEEPVVILQIKEKFGGLRFYTNYAPMEIHEMIEVAENDSFHICELCGEEGTLTSTKYGWITVRCKNCSYSETNSHC